MTAPIAIVQNSPPDTSYGFHRCCEAIRDVVPIENVARRYTKLEPLGGAAWFTGRCPLPDHGDKTPSFYIYPPGRFHCYGCGRSGDVVDLEFHCGDYGELWEAMIALAVDYGEELPERTGRWHEAQEPLCPSCGGGPRIAERPATPYAGDGHLADSHPEIWLYRGGILGRSLGASGGRYSSMSLA
jgi:CHC2-type zinc finger protein